MADLNIPNLNLKSDKYLFKNKLGIKRKSKKRLFFESAFMFILSLVLVYINYLIPNKVSLLQNLPSTLNKSLMLIIDLLSCLYEIMLLILILVSFSLSFLLIIGSINRILKIANRKKRLISYK